MQQTTNYGFNKPEYTDALDINVINGVMDKIDDDLFHLAESISLVQETNTATQDIANGTYVFWNNGLYKASTDIEKDDALSVSNLTAVTGGGMNADPNKSKWAYGNIQIDMTIASGSTYKTNLKTLIDNYLNEKNGRFGFIRLWHVADNHYDIVVQNCEYKDDPASFRARNYGSKSRNESAYVFFVYAPRG